MDTTTLLLFAAFCAVGVAYVVFSPRSKSRTKGDATSGDLGLHGRTGRRDDDNGGAFDGDFGSGDGGGGGGGD